VKEAIACLAIVLTGTAGLVGGVRQFVHHFEVNGCRGYAAASGYETRFVDYTPMTWDCLVRTDNGHWVPSKQLHGVNQ
jgi:hypothetical protein